MPTLEQVLEIPLPPPRQAAFFGISARPPGTQVMPGLARPTATPIPEPGLLSMLLNRIEDIGEDLAEQAANQLAANFAELMFKLGADVPGDAKKAYETLLKGISGTDLIRLYQGAALGLGRRIAREAMRAIAGKEVFESVGMFISEEAAQAARDIVRGRAELAARARLRSLPSERTPRFARTIREGLAKEFERAFKRQEAKRSIQSQKSLTVSIAVVAIVDPVKVENTIMALGWLASALRKARVAANWYVAAYYRRARMAFARQIGAGGSRWASLSETTIQAREMRIGYYELPASPAVGQFPIGVWTGAMAAGFTQPDATESFFQHTETSNSTEMTVGVVSSKKAREFVSGVREDDNELPLPARPVAETEDVATKMTFDRIQRSIFEVVSMAQASIDRPSGHFAQTWARMTTNEMVAYAREFLKQDIEYVF